jgi:hypothetical protein
MLTAIELHAPGVFDPDQIRVLVAALEDTWQKLLESGVRFGSDRERSSDAERTRQVCRPDQAQITERTTR